MYDKPNRIVLSANGPRRRIGVYVDGDELAAEYDQITAIPLDARQCWGLRRYAEDEEVKPFRSAREVKAHYGEGVEIARRIEVQLLTIRTESNIITPLREIARAAEVCRAERRFLSMFVDITCLRARGFKGDLLHRAFWGSGGPSRALQDMRRLSTKRAVSPPAMVLFADGSVQDKAAFRPHFIDPLKVAATIGEDILALVLGFADQHLDEIRGWAQAWPEPGVKAARGGFSASIGELLARAEGREEGEE